jgi:hypothetical protein
VIYSPPSRERRRGREMDRYVIIAVIIMLVLLSALGCEDEPTATSAERYSETVEGSFAVGDSSTLTIQDFVGSVVVRPGESGLIQVSAVKWAERQEDLEEIDVEMSMMQGSVQILCDNPSDLDNVSVDLEVTTPADTRPTLTIGVGSTRYEGRAEGECHFETGVGSIRLALPADVNVSVQLGVGVGSIEVGFPVIGQVSGTSVNGIIGTGLDGEIDAHVGVGSIVLVPQ